MMECCAGVAMGRASGHDRQMKKHPETCGPGKPRQSAARNGCVAQRKIHCGAKSRFQVELQTQIGRQDNPRGPSSFFRAVIMPDLQSSHCNSPRRAYTPAIDMKANHSATALRRPAAAAAMRRRLQP